METKNLQKKLLELTHKYPNNQEVILCRTEIAMRIMEVPLFAVNVRYFCDQLDQAFSPESEIIIDSTLAQLLQQNTDLLLNACRKVDELYKKLAGLLSKLGEDVSFYTDTHPIG